MNEQFVQVMKSTPILAVVNFLKLVGIGSKMSFWPFEVILKIGDIGLLMQRDGIPAGTD